MTVKEHDISLQPHLVIRNGNKTPNVKLENAYFGTGKKYTLCSVSGALFTWSCFYSTDIEHVDIVISAVAHDIGSCGVQNKS